MPTRILIADDYTALLPPLTLLLHRAGYEVTTTTNGRDALCLLRNDPPHNLPHDLLVLDMKMPGGGGKRVLDELGPTAPPVIVISGEPEPDVMPSAKVVRWFTKPFEPDDLVAAVKKFTGEKP